MQIQSIKNISYNQKNISIRGIEKNSQKLNSNKKEQNPYKTRNTSIGFVLGFLGAYALLKLFRYPIPKELLPLKDKLCKYQQ